MLIKTQDLKGIALDWAVLKCETGPPCGSFLDDISVHPNYSNYHPSTCWTRGGPIIEREGINLRSYSRIKSAFKFINGEVKYPETGNTVLEAAMRCYVASRLGNEVDVPESVLG